MTTENLEHALRKLRHIYEQLIHGHVHKTDEAHRSIANGLLSPAIADVERYIEARRRYDELDDEMNAW